MAEPVAAPSTEETVGASADASAVVPIPVEDDVVIEAGDAAVEYDADGAVSKDSLVMLLRHLTERVQERRVALKAAVEAGEMPESEFELSIFSRVALLRKRACLLGALVDGRRFTYLRFRQCPRALSVDLFGVVLAPRRVTSLPRRAPAVRR